MDAQAELDGFLDKFLPDVAADAREAIRFLSDRLPTATRLVYDNYNALAVGFGPSERSSEAIFSIAVYPRYASLFFLQNGAELPDPDRLLEGSGNAVRHIKLKPVSRVREPPVAELIDSALAQANMPLPASGEGPFVTKSVSAKQRPRRP